MQDLEEDLPIISHRAPATNESGLNEAAIDPDLPIIDPHHHFSPHWGGYFANDLWADMRAGHAITATVYIQCGHAYRSIGPEHLKPVGETEYVVAQTSSVASPGNGIAAGIVGYADLRLGDGVTEVLAAHIAVGQGRFRGIRQAGARHAAFKHGVLSRPPAGLYGDAEFRKGYAKLAEYELSFDAWIYHPQIDEVVSLARAFPHIPLIVDHVGGILGVGPYAGNASTALREWLPGLKNLAACPNVRVKLGGLGTATFGFDFSEVQSPPDSEVLAALWRPYIEPCIDLFGVDRCMFESNFPVDRSASSYVILWNTFKRIADVCSPEERSALFYGTAASTYKLSPLVPIA